MKTHPYADLFPMMAEPELRELAADIKANGLGEPVVLLMGMILDGRNRFAACELAGVPVRTTEFDGDDALAFVLSKNLKRRHLTESQRAMLAADLANLSKGQNKPKTPQKREENAEDAPIGASDGEPETPVIIAISQPEAAKVVGASKRSTQRAAKVKEVGGEKLADEVRQGRKTVAAAEREVKAKASQPAQVSEQAEPLKVAADAFCGRINAMTRQLDEMVRQCDELKVQPLGYEIHWLSITDSLKQIRQRLHAGRPKQPCPYCKRKGTKEGGRAACTACNGTGHVNETGYRSGCKAVGFHVEEDTE